MNINKEVKIHDTDVDYQKLCICTGVKLKEKLVIKMLNSNDNEIIQSDTPVCPYCGFVSTDLKGFLDKTSGIYRCTECSKLYSWTFEYEVHFYTQKYDKPTNENSQN
jgi:DNA-directed RNA polymerase subunit RPC12/RpoP